MKTRIRVLAAMGLCLLVGCATGVKTTDIAVRLGMSRDDLKLFFGEPLRIEAGAAGAEDWYYRFVAWRTQPTSESGTSVEPGGTTSYVSMGLAISRDPEERPVHISPQGLVIGPLPNGKIVLR
jgi:hypothetical protein